MRTINKMVIQPNTPNDNKVLWLNKNNASYYNNGTWVTIGESSEDMRELEEKVDSLDVDMQTVENEIQDINSRHNTLNTKHESLSRTVQGIAATGGASTATNVTYDNNVSELNAENVQDAIDELSSIGHFTKRGGVVNISTNYNSEHTAEVLTLAQAFSKVPSTDRVLGFQGKYLASDGWHTIIYIGDNLTSWSDTTKWIDLADKIFKSISTNATFAGIATPTTNPGTPNGPVFYIATEAGTYSNFNGISVADGKVAILEWKDGWVNKTTGFATSTKVSELEGDITEVSLNLEKTKAKIPIKYHSEDALYFTDSKGYVIAKIDKDGIQSVGNKTPTLDDKYKTWLYGKTIWGVGTSQWGNGIVLSTLANATGAIYDNDKCNDVNHFTISGGTYYLTPNKGTCARLRNLLWWKEQGESIDAIFFMIGNDTIPTRESEIGTIDDDSYFVTEEFTSGYVAESWDDLKTVVVNNISLYVGEHAPKVGAACMAKYKERYAKAVLSVNSLPTSNGNCAIVADGFAYQFSVSSDDSIETIINNIAITSYEGYSTSINSDDNTITFTRNEETSDSNISFEDTDGTGLTLNIQLTKDVSEYMVCYIGKDTSTEAWNTSSNWTYNSSISYISKIKGLLEYITANFKGSKLFYVDMNGYDWRKSEDYWYADGTINYSKYYKLKLESIDKRAELLKEYCKRYAIKFIDIDHTCGFNVANIMDYFPERGVHPNSNGYKIWGQALLLNVIK